MLIEAQYAYSNEHALKTFHGGCGGLVVDYVTLNQEALGSISTQGAILCP